MRQKLVVGFMLFGLSACFPGQRSSDDPTGGNSGLSSVQLPSVEDVNSIDFGGKKAASARLFIFKSGANRSFAKKKDCQTIGGLISFGSDGFCSLRIAKSGGEQSLASKINLKKGEGYVFALQLYSDAGSTVELAKTELSQPKSESFPCGYFEIAKAQNDQYEVGVPVCREGVKEVVTASKGSSVKIGVETPSLKKPAVAPTPAPAKPSTAAPAASSKALTCKCTKSMESDCKFSLAAMFESTAEWCATLPGQSFTISGATQNALFASGKIDKFTEMIRNCNSTEAKAKAQNNNVFFNASSFECK
jgi:hypothetical protein